MKTILRLIAFLRPFYGWVGLSVLLGTATVASGIGLLGTSAFLIARAAQHPSIAVLQVAIVGVRFFGISRGILRYLERLTSHRVTFQLLANLREWFYRSLIPLAPAHMQGQRSGDLLSMAVSDVNTLENFYVRVVAPPLVAILTGLGVCLFVGRYQPLFGIIIASGLFLSGALIPFWVYAASRRSGQHVVDARARINTLFVEGLQGARDLQVYGQHVAYQQKIIQAGLGLAKAERRLVWIGSLLSGITGLSANMTLWLMLLAAIPLVNVGRLGGVDLAVLSLVTLASFEAVAPLGLTARHLSSAVRAASRLFALTDAKPSISEPESPLAAPLTGNLRVKNLYFNYDAGMPPVLKHINLDLPAGKQIAIVGPSGAGKSTLLNLLLRFWDVPAGMIDWAGQDIRRYTSSDLRKRFSVIPASIYIFSATLRQNLLLANPMASDAELFAALQRVGLGDWFAHLPDGWNTWLGEHGQAMSGGERQKIAVARALMSNGAVWLLDEPTSQLDAFSEKTLIEALHYVTSGRSVIWVTHRLVGLENMDEIIVLDKGSIVERGTQAQLLAKNGIYMKMWFLQHRLLLEDGGT